MNRVVVALAGVATALGVMLVTTNGSAGYQLPVPSAYCNKNSDGSGYCYANQLAFRNNSDPNAYSLFILTSYSQSFSAYLNGVSYSCTVPSNQPSVAAVWPMLINSNGWYNVNWNSSGQCTSAAATNYSYYAQSF